MKTVRLIWVAETGKHVPEAEARGRPPRRGQFIPPIPADWFKAAARLKSGRAVVVAAIIRFEAAKRHTKQIKFTGRMSESFGISPSTRKDGLAALEVAGLIRVERRRGSSPVITIVELD